MEMRSTTGVMLCQNRPTVDGCIFLGGTLKKNLV
jgi:hypothetical protein